jgi:gluconolactonase
MHQVARAETPAGVEVLARGYQLAEAPRADGAGGIWFTDALGGGVHHWRDGQIDTLVPSWRGIGGLAVHADGGVVTSGRNLSHVAPDGTARLLWDPPEGIAGLNDICALPSGAVLAGALRFRPFAGEDPVVGEFWRVTGDQACIEVPGVHWPNGCGADEQRDRTYACDYARGIVWVRDATAVRVFTETPTGDADGLAIDHEGGVWVASPKAGAILRFTPDGVHDRTIELGAMVTSCAFDGDVMYVTTMASVTDDDGVLLRLPAPVPGPIHHFSNL